MSTIYYPKGTKVFQRDALSGSYEQLELSTTPNAIFYFDTSSTLNYVSSSTLYLTASNALTARPGLMTSWLTDAAVLQTDGTLADHFRVVLGGNRILGNATSSYDGQRLSWEFIQDESGTRTITLSSSYVTGSDFSVLLNQTASKRDFMTAMASGSGATAVWYVLGFVKGY